MNFISIGQSGIDTVHYFSKLHSVDDFFTLPDSLPDGKWVAFSDANKSKIGLIIHYRNGKRNGECTSYWSNGNIESIVYYKSGCQVGKAELWYEDGGKHAEEFWNIIDSTKNYSQSILLNYWTKDGKQAVKDGTGTFPSYHPNGVLQIQEQYLNGKMTGEWTWYFSNGKINYIENYKEGKQDGEYIMYYFNGQIESKGLYSNGKQVGLWQTYYNNGQIKESVDRKYGRRDGEYNYWSENGQLINHGSYKMGLEDGVWQHWDDDGKLIEETTYSEGKIINVKKM